MKDASLEKEQFKSAAMTEDHPLWNDAVAREKQIYKRTNEIRSDFARDFNRILHCTAYRRLKHKTQVFFAVTNDHICTRMEHVNHVTSIGYTISKFLGLNSELSVAIAIGHDLGHAPFGHAGEKVIEELYQKVHPTIPFWHEQNSLRFIDNIETLESPSGKHENLNLTYAVRDGIICHCGEVDDTQLIPRKSKINLKDIKKSERVQPYTWEGCVIKISDKIAYLGRDIEDAVCLEILNERQMGELDQILKDYGIEGDVRANNTMLIHSFIIDLCKESSLANGIRLSAKFSDLMKAIKDYNYKNIYAHERIMRYKNYVHLVIFALYDVIKKMANEVVYRKSSETFKFSALYKDFLLFLKKYSVDFKSDDINSEIYKIYNLRSDDELNQACIDFISGMTDTYAIKMYNSIISF